MIFGVPVNVYFNGFEHVHIGHHVYIAPGVCTTTANHDIIDPGIGQPIEPITIGDYCWIGANAVILPGVTLGPHTIVGAGAIVTHSFPEGHMVITGNPARKLKDIPQTSKGEK